MIAYHEVWCAARPYMRVRRNDVHIPLSFDYAQKLIKAYPEADADIVSIAILLHDIGWYSIDEDEIFSKGFGPNMMQSDVRFLHETEGVRLATELLNKLNYSPEFITSVCEIIDGHDTRPKAKSLNDELVRDADKLWRFSITGIAVASPWFKKTPSEYILQLEEKTFKELTTDEAKKIALNDLKNSKSALKVEVL